MDPTHTTPAKSCNMYRVHINYLDTYLDNGFTHPFLKT